MFVLLLTTFIVPYRLAFSPDDTIEWVIAYYLIDLMFLIDVFLCFVTTYTDSYKQIEITNHKKIAFHYLKGWFLIDILSIFPFDLIMGDEL